MEQCRHETEGTGGGWLKTGRGDLQAPNLKSPLQRRWL